MLLRTYVVDSAVLTDLEVADALLEAGLPMPFRLVAADLYQAYGEPEKHDTRDLEEFEFEVVSLDGDELDEATRLGLIHLELSIHDVAAHALCVSRGYGLLTRNPRLVAAARDKGAIKRREIRVHGTLWLLEQLATHGRMSRSEAVKAVRTMQEEGRNLDPSACDRFFKKWGRPLGT